MAQAQIDFVGRVQLRCDRRDFRVDVPGQGGSVVRSGKKAAVSFRDE